MDHAEQHGADGTRWRELQAKRRAAFVAEGRNLDAERRQRFDRQLLNALDQTDHNVRRFGRLPRTEAEWRKVFAPLGYAPSWWLKAEIGGLTAHLRKLGAGHPDKGVERELRLHLRMLWGLLGETDPLRAP